MRHDFESHHKLAGCNHQGFMSYGEKPDKWSKCSNEDYSDWFNEKGYVCSTLEFGSTDCGEGRRRGNEALLAKLH